MHNLRIFNPGPPPRGYTPIVRAGAVNNNNNNPGDGHLNNANLPVPIFSTLSTSSKKVIEKASSNNAPVTFTVAVTNKKQGTAAASTRYEMSRENIVAFNNIGREQLVIQGEVNIDKFFVDNNNNNVDDDAAVAEAGAVAVAAVAVSRPNKIFDSVPRLDILDMLNKTQCEHLYFAKKSFDRWFSQYVDTAYQKKKEDKFTNETNNKQHKNKSNVYNFMQELEKTQGDIAGYFTKAGLVTTNNKKSVSEHARAFVEGILQHLKDKQQLIVDKS